MMGPLIASKASFQVIERLTAQGYEAVFVGGAVRDHLLGKQATDIDIATSAEPKELQGIFDHTIDVGIEHGTILVIMDDESIEVTTYRTGESTGQVKSLQEDLLRRDFTINALAMTHEGRLIDFYGGQEDLNRRLIRAVDRPEARFKEDPLRLLRAIRFAAVLDFTIEQETLEAIQHQAGCLAGVAVERIKIELDKMFCGVNLEKGLHILIESKLAPALPLFPTTASDLKGLFPFHSTQEGWAYIMLAGHFTARAMSQAYKLSNEEKRFLTNIEKAYQIRLRRTFNRNDIYQYAACVLDLVEKFYAVVNEEEMPDSIQTFELEKQQLPIQSMKDLQVSGQDLLKWANIRGGRWVGEWMEKIEYAVLHGQCENDSERIKEWFINDFDSKG